MRSDAYALAMPYTIDMLLSALAEPTRLRALQLLWDGGEHCVCELMDRLDASQSRMSRHMQRLKRAGLVADRRDAQWVRYRRCMDLPHDWVVVIEAILEALPPVASPSCRKKAA